MNAIKNARIVLEDGILDRGVILWDKGRIVAVGNEDEIEIPQGTECMDAKGNLVGPGLVDIHCHGGNGFEFSQNPKEAGEYFLSQGTTTILATLYYTLGKEEFLSAIDGTKQVMEGSNIAGFYMEGPYMNPKYGASPERNQWRGTIRREDYMELIERAGTHAKVWAVAPEREGIEAFVKDAKEKNPRATIAVGHSEASPKEVQALKTYGLCLETHCMNATGYPEREYLGTKNCGPDEACLMDSDMYAELICDSMGIHVPPDLLQYVLTLKGVDRVILISDSFVSEQPSPDHLSHITDLQFDENGNLSGSRLTLAVACRNMMHHCGCGMVDLFKMASRNPARVIGMENEIGSIQVGKRANLIVIDDDFELHEVIFQGDKIEKGCDTVC